MRAKERECPVDQAQGFPCRLRWAVRGISAPPASCCSPRIWRTIVLPSPSSSAPHSTILGHDNNRLCGRAWLCSLGLGRMATSPEDYHSARRAWQHRCRQRCPPGTAPHAWRAPAAWGSPPRQTSAGKPRRYPGGSLRSPATNTDLACHADLAGVPTTRVQAGSSSRAGQSSGRCWRPDRHIALRR